MNNTPITNAKVLAERFKIDRKTVEALLKRAQVEPVAEVPLGKGTMRMYATAPAEAAVQAYLAVRAQEREQKAQAAAPAEVNTSSREMDGVRETLAALEDTAQAHGEKLDKLLNQNVLLLRAIDDLKTTVQNEFTKVATRADIQSVVGALNGLAVASFTPPPTASPTLAPPPAQKASTASRHKIVVVGLTDAQFAQIAKEFGTCFDLRHVVADQASGKGFASVVDGAAAVISMTRFVNHGFEDVVRQRGVKLIRVTGAMSALRDRLTQLFVDADKELKK